MGGFFSPIFLLEVHVPSARGLGISTMPPLAGAGALCIPRSPLHPLVFIQARYLMSPATVPKARCLLGLQEPDPTVAPWPPPHPAAGQDGAGSFPLGAAQPPSPPAPAAAGAAPSPGGGVSGLLSLSSSCFFSPRSFLLSPGCQFPSLLPGPTLAVPHCAVPASHTRGQGPWLCLRKLRGALVPLGRPRCHVVLALV